MARYRYSNEVTPPAPFVLVTLRNPVTGEERRDFPAQVDTAADRTVLPESLELNLNVTGFRPIGSFGGAVSVVPSYAVLLGVHTFPLSLTEVLAHPAERWVLLGRDVLNHLRTLLDGPGTALEIDPPT